MGEDSSYVVVCGIGLGGVFVWGRYGGWKVVSLVSGGEGFCFFVEVFECFLRRVGF